MVRFPLRLPRPAGEVHQRAQEVHQGGRLWTVRTQQVQIVYKVFQISNVIVRCGRHRSLKHQETIWQDPCFEKTNRQYRFLVAMENTLCRDYLSEKIYNALLQVRKSQGMKETPLGKAYWDCRKVRKATRAFKRDSILKGKHPRRDFKGPIVSRL